LNGPDACGAWSTSTAGAPRRLTRQLYDQLRSAIAERAAATRVSLALRAACSPGHLDVSAQHGFFLPPSISWQPRATSIIARAAAVPRLPGGLVPPPGLPLSHAGGPAAAVRQRLSGWARRIGQSDWAFFQHEGAARPFTARDLARWASVFPHDIWGAMACARAARQRSSREASATHKPPGVAGGPGPISHRASRRSERKPRQIHCHAPRQQAAIELIARVILEAGDIAWLESPGYGGARVALEAAGAHVDRVCLSTAAVWHSAGRKDRPRLIFVTAVTINTRPGKLMPIDRRLELLAVLEVPLAPY